VALQVDVADRSQLQPALAAVESALGPVSILVNNAAVAAFGGVLDLSVEDWDRVIETDLTACFLLAKYAAQSMTKRQAGKIINIASTYSLFGSALAPSYSAAKGAIMQLTKSLAIELAVHNIQVNAILPGWISTDLTEPIDENSPVVLVVLDDQDLLTIHGWCLSCGRTPTRPTRPRCGAGCRSHSAHTHSSAFQIPGKGTARAMPLAVRVDTGYRRAPLSLSKPRDRWMRPLSVAPPPPRTTDEAMTAVRQN